MKSHRRADTAEAYNIWVDCSEDIARSIIIFVLYILDKRHWHRENILKLYEDIIALLTTPMRIFGKEVSNLDIEKYIVGKYGIDLNRVKLNLAPMGSGKRKDK